jgi:hypothetical protein
VSVCTGSKQQSEDTAAFYLYTHTVSTSATHTRKYAIGLGISFRSITAALFSDQSIRMKPLCAAHTCMDGRLETSLNYCKQQRSRENPLQKMPLKTHL